MAFEIIRPKSYRSSDGLPLIGIAKTTIRFNIGFITLFGLEKMRFVEFYYDEQTDRIAVRALEEPSPMSYIVQLPNDRENGSRYCTGGSLLLFIKDKYGEEIYQQYQVTKERDRENGGSMYVIQLPKKKDSQVIKSDV